MSVRPEAICTLDDGSFTVVFSDREQYPDIPVTTLHLSCASDVYEGPSNRYAGFVLYAHNRQTVWTLNGRKCRTGYIVVQDTDSPGVQRCISNSEGVVHGAVYKNVFGEDIGDTVGEAFAVIKGEFRWMSGTFNNRTYCTSHYHDKGRGMSTVSEKYVSKVLKFWMDAGLEECCVPCMRNYNIDDLK